MLIKVKWGGGGNFLTITTLFDLIRGVTYSKTEQIHEESPNVILTADNITEVGQFRIAKKVYLQSDITLDPNKRLKKGDIFICLSSGSKTHIGKLCLISEDTPYYAGGFMGILRAKGHINTTYVAGLLNQAVYRDRVRELSSGANINNLSSKLGDIKIPVPPIAEQERIVAEVEAYEAKIREAEQVIAGCVERKAAILRHYLR